MMVKEGQGRGEVPTAESNKQSHCIIHNSTRGNLFSVLSPETPSLCSLPKGEHVAWGAADATEAGGGSSEEDATVENEWRTNGLAEDRGGVVSIDTECGAVKVS